MPGAIRNVQPHEAKARVGADLLQARELEGNVVVVVEVIEADNFVAALEQHACGEVADEAGGAGNQELHYNRPSTSSALNTYLMS